MDPVVATIVQVAKACGRSVVEVARQSYALTLWTSWHLGQQQRMQWIDDRSNRFDLAGLITAGYHEPSSLGEQFNSFLDDITVNPAAASDTLVRSARLKKMLRDHARLVPVPE